MLAPDLVTLPAGEYLMGETPGDKFANDTERPRHWVRVPSFQLGRFPVTVAAYREFRPDWSPAAADEIPVTGVSWREAVAYCEWLGARCGLALRLPSEAEWEYAARAGTDTLYPWNEEPTTAVANYLYAENGARIGPGHPTPAGAYPPNGFGLMDLLGNVAEWASDIWHPDYHGAPADGSARETPARSPQLRVIRGGAWDYLPRLLRPSWRDGHDESRFRDNLGFRIAASPA